MFQNMDNEKEEKLEPKTKEEIKFEDYDDAENDGIEGIKEENTDDEDGDEDPENNVKPAITECPECGKTFNTKTLQRHIRRIHLKETKYDCELEGCDKKFYSMVELKRHLIRHALDKGEHVDPIELAKYKGDKGVTKCPICCKIVRINKLKIHTKNVHEAEMKHKCLQCSYASVTAAQLRAHMLSHSDEKNHSCEVCGKSFKTKSYIKSHMRTHTGEKPYSCKYCGVSFSDQSGCQGHEKAVHEGIQTVSCHLCGKIVKKNKQLRRHMAAHERQNMIALGLPVPPTAKQLKRNPNAPTRIIRPKTSKKDHGSNKKPSRRPHTCNQCGKVLSDKYLVRKHKMSSSTGCSWDGSFGTELDNEQFAEYLAEQQNKAIPAACNQCGKVFQCSKSVRQHKTSNGTSCYWDEIPGIELTEGQVKEYQEQQEDQKILSNNLELVWPLSPWQLPLLAILVSLAHFALLAHFAPLDHFFPYCQY